MIAEKLAAIQAALKAPKSQYNDFGKYKYRSCEDILEAVKPLLNGSAVTLSDEVVSVGNRIYIKATATLKDNEGEISVTAYAREEETKKGMDGSQITGSASSYARKYALNGLFAIDDTKDADATNNAAEAPTSPKTANTGKRSETPKQAATSQTISLDEALSYEVELKGNVYKIGDMSDEQLTWLIGKAGGKVKACAEIVHKRRLADYKAGLQEYDGDLPF